MRVEPQSDLFRVERASVLRTQLEFEAWTARRLGKLELLAGATDAAERRERVRQTLLPIGPIVVGHRPSGGPAETWSSLFERIYGEPLQPAGRAPSSHKKSLETTP